MAWIESHQTLARHPKTRKFARVLGIGIPQAIGHLHLLWWWAMDYAQDGSLADFDGADIADACQWSGDPVVLLDALLTCGNPGFLEMCEGVYHIHDWQEYGGKLLEQRQANAERMRTARAKREEYRATHVQDTFTTRAGLENSTGENSRGEESIARAGARASSHSQEKSSHHFTGRGKANGNSRSATAQAVENLQQLAREAHNLDEEPDNRRLSPGWQDAAGRKRA